VARWTRRPLTAAAISERPRRTGPSAVRMRSSVCPRCGGRTALAELSVTASRTERIEVIERVVVPVSLTTEAERALFVAPVLAGWAGASVELLSVVKPIDRASMEAIIQGAARDSGAAGERPDRRIRWSGGGRVGDRTAPGEQGAVVRRFTQPIGAGRTLARQRERGAGSPGACPDRARGPPARPARRRAG
jgi:hypothetical protein